MGFVNGIPLLFMELKNVNKDTRAAYEQNLADYKDTVPHLFHHNAVIVLGNGVDARLGSLSSRYEHFHAWKRLDEDEPGVVDMETLALFDLLVKPDLSKKEIERLEQVATELLAKLKEEKLRADNWREKQATRDAVKVEIRDFLWNEETGLPVQCYAEHEVEEKAEQVYLHIFNLYDSPHSDVSNRPLL